MLVVALQTFTPPNSHSSSPQKVFWKNPQINCLQIHSKVIYCQWCQNPPWRLSHERVPARRNANGGNYGSRMMFWFGVMIWFQEKQCSTLKRFLTTVQHWNTDMVCSLLVETETLLQLVLIALKHRGATLLYTKWTFGMGNLLLRFSRWIAFQADLC